MKAQQVFLNYGQMLSYLATFMHLFISTTPTVKTIDTINRWFFVYIIICCSYPHIKIYNHIHLCMFIMLEACILVIQFLCKLLIYFAVSLQDSKIITVALYCDQKTITTSLSFCNQISMYTWDNTWYLYIAYMR